MERERLREVEIKKETGLNKECGNAERIFSVGMGGDKCGERGGKVHGGETVRAPLPITVEPRHRHLGAST